MQCSVARHSKIRSLSRDGGKDKELKYERYASVVNDTPHAHYSQGL